MTKENMLYLIIGLAVGFAAALPIYHYAYGLIFSTVKDKFEALARDAVQKIAPPAALELMRVSDTAQKDIREAAMKPRDEMLDMLNVLKTVKASLAPEHSELAETISGYLENGKSNESRAAAKIAVERFQEKRGISKTEKSIEDGSLDDYCDKHFASIYNFDQSDKISDGEFGEIKFLGTIQFSNTRYSIYQAIYVGNVLDETNKTTVMFIRQSGNIYLNSVFVPTNVPSLRVITDYLDLELSECGQVQNENGKDVEVKILPISEAEYKFDGIVVESFDIPYTLNDFQDVKDIAVFEWHHKATNAGYIVSTARPQFAGLFHIPYLSECFIVRQTWDNKNLAYLLKPNDVENGELRVYDFLRNNEAANCKKEDCQVEFHFGEDMPMAIKRLNQ